jgi:uncharacterized integral membrane protein
MMSYFLGIVIVMLLSAVYAFQNTAEVTVNFLFLTNVFPQGVWEVIVFAAGAVIMWFFSVCASIETRSGNRKRFREQNRRIEELEKDKKSLMNTLEKIEPGRQAPGAFTQFRPDTPLKNDAPETYETPAPAAAETGDAETESAEPKKTFLPPFLSSLFSPKAKKEEPEGENFSARDGESFRETAGGEPERAPESDAEGGEKKEPFSV